MATDPSTIPLYCKYIHSAKQAHMMPPLKQLNIKTHLRIYRRVGFPAGTLYNPHFEEDRLINLLDSQTIDLIES